MARIQLRRKWYEWNANREDMPEDIASGKTPEEAIEKIRSKYPECMDSEVIYNVLTRRHAQDVNECPVCHKPVRYIKAKKANNHKGIMVIHMEDALPDGAIVLDSESISKDYMRMLLKEFHKGLTITSQIQEAVSETSPEVQESKIIVKAKIEEAAKVIKNLNIVNIDGMRHNRFAIVGEIVKSMKNSGTPEDKINSIRSELINGGKDFNSLVQVASQHVILQENGRPVQITSGI